MQWRALNQVTCYEALSGEWTAIVVGEWGEATFPLEIHPGGTTEEPTDGLDPPLL